jgi:transposase
MEGLLETIRFLEAENAALKKLASELLAELAMLRDESAMLRAELALLRRHSGSSSKPPSSDIVKPPQDNLGKRKKSRRKIGAQKGHPKHDRIYFTKAQIDTTIEHELTQCPHCNGKLTKTDKITKTQQVELADKPIFVTEHHQPHYWCENCQEYHVKPLPEQVRKEGLFRPKMTSLVGYLRGQCHLAFRPMREFFKDVFGVNVSTGFLSGQVKKVSDSLESLQPITQ